MEILKVEKLSFNEKMLEDYRKVYKPKKCTHTHTHITVC